MKEHENNMEAIDKLFRQSLEDYCPAPPPDVETALMQKYTLKPSVWVKLTRFLNLNTFLITTAVLVLTGAAYFLTNRTNDIQPELKADNTFLTSDSANHTDQPISDSNLTRVNNNKPVNSNKIRAIVPNPSNHINLKYNGISITISASLPSIPSAIRDDFDNNLSENGLIDAENQKGKIQESESPANNIAVFPEISINSSEPITEQLISDKDVVVNDADTRQNIAGKNNDILSDNNRKNGENPAQPVSGKSKDKSKGKPDFGYNVSLLPTFGGIFQKSRDVNIFYGGQINAGVIYKPIKIGLETGFGYEKYTDRGGYEFTYQKMDTVGITYDTTWIMQDSMWYPEVSTNYLTQSRQLTDVTTTHLSYSYFMVPLYLTKQIYENKIFRVGIKSGVNVIFLSSKSEPVPSQSTSMGTFLSAENQSFTRNNLVWQFVISPQILFHLNRRLYLQIEPTYRKFLNELYIGSVKPAGVPNPFSVNAGLRFEW
jgi:hypothetical protein